jgi:hypothetical protein
MTAKTFFVVFVVKERQNQEGKIEQNKILEAVFSYDHVGLYLAKNLIADLLPKKSVLETITLRTNL